MVKVILHLSFMFHLSPGVVSGVEVIPIGGDSSTIGYTSASLRGRRKKDKKNASDPDREIHYVL